MWGQDTTIEMNLPIERQNDGREKIILLKLPNPYGPLLLSIYNKIIIATTAYATYLLSFDSGCVYASLSSFSLWHI